MTFQQMNTNMDTMMSGRSATGCTAQLIFGMQL